jgi:hypothetical protein
MNNEMFSEFYIDKQSGTYSETLEAFGVGNLLYEILKRNNVQGIKLTIEDLDYRYLVKPNQPITNEHIEALSYFQIFKFIKKDVNQTLPAGIPENECFNYPANKAVQDDYKAKFAHIEKLKSEDEKKAARKKLNEEKLSEFGKRIDAEYDAYRELIKNPYTSFTKLFENAYLNQSNFQKLVRAILTKYTQQENSILNFNLSERTPTAQQLFNPNQGKGLNKGKANNASMGNLSSDWISETMKISGALSYMVCQYVKVGTSYDMKIFVPEFNQIGLKDAKDILFDFKKYLKSNSPIKLDIINSINFTINFIRHTPKYTGKVRKTLKGFHTVYQKDLGQNKAVANIAFINTPDFIEYNNQDEAGEWIEILEQQRNLISNIKEQGDSIQGLQSYRNFLGAIGNSALEYFTDFSYWYGNYLMQQLTKGSRFVRTFKTEHLNKFYKNMDTQELNLSEIIQNEGFLAVAKAIRKSTVSLQYTPKDQRKFEIRYGLAQQLQNKSKSKEDLATFIGDFIGIYNAETGRNAEKNDGKSLRANVKDEELAQFYSIADKFPARLVGALLASYGFALTKKDTPKDEPQNDDETSQDNN